jgi:hypothetical protein
MSFETLKVAELKKIAEDFAVDADALKNKTDIIAALTEEGVTWSVYQKTLKDLEDELDILDEAPKQDLNTDDGQEKVLVRMTRANFRYDILGHTFTKEHPFVAMKESTAQSIFDLEEGFRLATPKEVQEFYG